MRNLQRRTQECRRCFVIGIILGTFLPSAFLPPADAQTLSYLPPPGTSLSLSEPFSPVVIRGLQIFPDDPLKSNFIIDQGPGVFHEQEFSQESTKLIKYFLASLALPEDDRWVNLSPYEKNRIIPEKFAFTDMGRDLLAQDYLLKQLSASLTNPEKQLGKNFWDRVYGKAYKTWGVADVPMQTFNKVWIIPEKAVVHASGNTAFVVESRLKAMLEEDYKARLKTGDWRPETKNLTPATEVIREILIPEIEKEINEGKTFANLRQIYHSLILATWFRRKMEQSFLDQVYVGKGKVKGIEIEDRNVAEKIYQQYLQAFKVGVFNFIKEEYDPKTQEIIPRKYFSGGVKFTGQIGKTLEDDELTPKQLIASVDRKKQGPLKGVFVQLDPVKKDSKSAVILRSQRRLAQNDGETDSAILADLRPATQQILEKLNLTYEQFQNLAKAQTHFEEDLLQTDPVFRLNIFSARTLERFSKTVAKVTQDLRERNVPSPLTYAIQFAITQYYQDLLTIRFPHELAHWRGMILQYFGPFIPKDFVVEKLPQMPFYYNMDDSVEGRVIRSFWADYPVILKEETQSDRRLMDVMRRVAENQQMDLTFLWAHPFTNESQLVGRKVPAPEKDELVFGPGVLMRQILAAMENPSRRYVLVIKNIEAVDTEVRLQLQELLRFGEMSHPSLGKVQRPDNLQIVFTMNEETMTQDNSFDDRTIVKTIPADENFKPPVLESLPDGINETNFLEAVTVEEEQGRKILVLPGARIVLGERFQDVTRDNFYEKIYSAAGMLLDFETVKMLAAMEQAVKQHFPILRLVGPTGVGKTFTARGEALMRGSEFLTNPVSQGSEISDWIGAFEYDDNGRLYFNGQTSFKDRLENGGIVALSELNTLVDQNEKVSMAWWLTQIAQTPPDQQGFRAIPLSEIPVAPGQAYPTIRIHPRTLIVVDVNPEDYSGRGKFPNVFEEETPVISVQPLLTGDPDLLDKEEAKIRYFVNQFLSMDWIIDGQVKAPRLTDAQRREELAGRLSGIFYGFVCIYDPLHRRDEKFVFSLRDLKRMTEDILFSMAKGAEPEEAVSRTVLHHLVSRWADAAYQEDVKDYFERDWGLDFQDTSLNKILTDELLHKNRSVHLRVHPFVNTRSLLEEFQQQNKNAVIKFISVTREPDRSKLEGGRTPGYDGITYETGAGSIGHLIDDAQAHGDRDIVYVLENIHNLQPEDAVALNEVLPEGIYYMKGQDTRRKIPSNAHILVVSRSDSPMDWSAAEKSRYVMIGADGYRNREEVHADFIERVKTIFQKFLQPDVAEKIVGTVRLMTSQAQDAIEKNRVYRNRLSQQMFVRFTNHLEKSLQKMRTEQRTLTYVVEAIQSAMDYAFGSGLPEPLRRQLEPLWTMDIRLLIPAITSADIFIPEIPAPAPQTEVSPKTIPLAQQLAEARHTIITTQDEQVRENTVKALGKILHQNEDQLVKTHVADTQLQPGDVMEVFYRQMTQQLPAAEFVDQAYSTRKEIIIGSGRRLWVFNRNPDGTVDSHPVLIVPVDLVMPCYVSSIFATEDNIFAATSTGRILIIKKNDRNEWDRESIDVRRLKRGAPTSIAVQGDQLFIGTSMGLAVFQRNSAGEWGREPVFKRGLKGDAHSLIVQGDQIFVATTRNYLYVFGKNDEQTWSSIPLLRKKWDQELGSLKVSDKHIYLGYANALVIWSMNGMCRVSPMIFLDRKIIGSSRSFIRSI